MKTKEKPRDYMKGFGYLVSEESEKQKPTYDPNCEYFLFKFLSNYSINKTKGIIYLNFFGKDQKPYCLMIPLNKFDFFLKILKEIENKLKNEKDI